MELRIIAICLRKWIIARWNPKLATVQFIIVWMIFWAFLWFQHMFFVSQFRSDLFLYAFRICIPPASWSPKSPHCSPLFYYSFSFGKSDDFVIERISFENRKKFPSKTQRSFVKCLKIRETTKTVALFFFVYKLFFGISNMILF